MLNMKFQLLIKTKIHVPTNEEVALSLSDVVFIMLINEPRHAIMCLREINYVMRYDVVKSDVIISRRA